MSEYEIRPASAHDAAAIARVHTESWRTTYAGVMPEDYLAGLSVEKRTENWRRRLREVEAGARRQILVAVAPSGQGASAPELGVAISAGIRELG